MSLIDSTMKDYYNILGVDRNASKGDIQKAFRKLAHQHHPDKKDGDVNKFKEINEAYQVLNDEKKRAQYDAGGFTGNADGFHDFNGFDFSNFDINFGSRGGGFADMFSSIFHGMMNRGEDIQADITISFEESIFGTSKTISIPYRRKPTETIEIQVPAGIEPGSRVQFPERGEPSRDGRSSPGNLVIRINVDAHEKFERRGGDVIYPLKLTPTEAMLGTKKELQDLKGETCTVTVPEKSKEGAVIALQGRGIPRPAGNDRLIVICHIEYPKSINRKARRLLEDLREEGW